MKFTNILKTIILILIFVNIVPPLWHNFTAQWLENIEPKTKVAYMTITDLNTSDTYSTYLREYFKNPEIKAIFLHIESDGGNAGASQALVLEIQALKNKYPKPVIAYSENMCTSGGYYIACTADHIITTGACLVGNIGSAFTSQLNLKKLLNEHNIDAITIASGKYKTVFNNFQELSEDHKKMLQTICDDIYQQFITFVAQQRHLQVNTAQDWADGKLFSGQQAKQLHLTDTIGSKFDAIQFLKKTLIPSDKKIEWVRPPEHVLWKDWLFATPEAIDTIEYKAQHTFLHAITALFNKKTIAVE